MEVLSSFFIFNKSKFRNWFHSVKTTKASLSQAVSYSSEQ